MTCQKIVLCTPKSGGGGECASCGRFGLRWELLGVEEKRSVHDDTMHILNQSKVEHNKLTMKV
jgi:hypothetical protein